MTAGDRLLTAEVQAYAPEGRINAQQQAVC